MLLRCFGWSCPRMISVSKAPGGNPVALADPAHFAVSFRICLDCQRTYCDRCLPERSGLFRGPRCPSCGGKFADGARRQEVLSRPREPAADLHDEAVELAQRGLFEESLDVFDRVLRQRPGYVSAHFYRGLVLRELDRYPEAVDALERAAGLDPRNVLALYELAEVHRRAEQPERALDCYDRALRVQPRYLAALVDKAITLNGLDRPSAALDCAEQAIRLDAAGADAGRTEHLRAHAHAALGAALLRLGRPAEALAALDIAISDGPDHPETYYDRAEALAQLGRTEEAEQAHRVAEDLGDRW